MAFFKFRTPGKPGADAAASAVPPAPSIEIMRRRAKHRLIGAAVLVLLGVVGFPLLFDSQPRPVAVDIPIEIPDKTKVKPLVLGAVPSAEPVAVAPDISATPATPATPAAPQPVASVATAQEAKPEVPAKPQAKVAAPSDDGAKARALLDGKEAVAGVAAQGRFVVQVGAFSDAAKLREVRQKLEKSGIKTYTQVVDTKEGKRTRVRAGPFTSQAQADNVAARVKALDMPAAVLKM